MPDPQNTGDLVRAAAMGDQKAWETIVRRYAGLVWSVGQKFGLSSADTSDVAQTVWLRLVENLGKLREPELLGRWLVTTARRECIRVFNKRAREIPNDVAAVLDEMLDTSQPPIEHSLLSRERDATVRTAFEKLPPRCQHLLRLLLHDPPVPYNQIAAQLGVRPGYIGPTRGRCLDMLRRLLDAGQ